MPITKEDIDNAKQDADKRKADEKQAELKAKEKKENEAPRKAVGEAVDKAVDYVKGKAKDIADSDFAKGMRNYGRLYKEGLGMKPDTAYEKKKGGMVKSASARADGCCVRGKTRA
jgi:hypothetical protein